MSAVIETEATVPGTAPPIISSDDDNQAGPEQATEAPATEQKTTPSAATPAEEQQPVKEATTALASETPQKTVPPETAAQTQSSEPTPSDQCTIDGEPYAWMPGFGWVEVGGENVCIYDENIYENGNKVCEMG